MPKKCTPCLNDQARDLLLEAFPTLKLELKMVPTCEPGIPIRFCGKPQRKRSAWQEFASECLKGKNIKGFADAPRALRECSTEWKARKPK